MSGQGEVVGQENRNMREKREKTKGILLNPHHELCSVASGHASTFFCIVLVSNLIYSYADGASIHPSPNTIRLSSKP